jgi:hypothetical protein
MSKLLIILVIFGAGCSKLVDVDIPERIDAEAEIIAPESLEFGPDFEKASEFCDNRYGPGTDESEACFQDYRNYYSIQLGLDLEALVDFCEERAVGDVEACIEDLTNILSEVRNE